MTKTPFDSTGHHLTLFDNTNLSPHFLLSKNEPLPLASLGPSKGECDFRGLSGPLLLSASVKSDLRSSRECLPPFRLKWGLRTRDTDIDLS